MKKLSAVVLALFLMGAITAQPAGGNEFRERKGPDMEKMQIILELSDQQVAQWKQLHETQRAAQEAKREEIQKQRATQMEAMRQEREAMMQAHQNELKKILTPEQFKKFEAMRPEHPGPGAGQDRMGHPKGMQGQPKQLNKKDCYKNQEAPEKEGGTE